MKMSREGSRIGTHDQYYSDEQLQYVDLSNTPNNNYTNNTQSTSARLYEQSDIPELLEMSAESICAHTSMMERCGAVVNAPTATDYDNRCSLYDSENGQDTTYIADLVDQETTGSDITTVTRPLDTRGFGGLGTSYGGICQRGAQRESDASEGSEVSDDDDDDDDYTETWMCSDDDDDQPEDPLDPENTRKLERDIKRLLKDLQKRTEEV